MPPPEEGSRRRSSGKQTRNRTTANKGPAKSLKSVLQREGAPKFVATRGWRDEQNYVEMCRSTRSQPFVNRNYWKCERSWDGTELEKRVGFLSKTTANKIAAHCDVKRVDNGRTD